MLSRNCLPDHDYNHCFGITLLLFTKLFRINQAGNETRPEITDRQQAVTLGDTTVAARTTSPRALRALVAASDGATRSPPSAGLGATACSPERCIEAMCLLCDSLLKQGTRGPERGEMAGGREGAGTGTELGIRCRCSAFICTRSQC
jgi:hypothetical protein